MGGDPPGRYQIEYVSMDGDVVEGKFDFTVARKGGGLSRRLMPREEARLPLAGALPALPFHTPRAICERSSLTPKPAATTAATGWSFSRIRSTKRLLDLGDDVASVWPSYGLPGSAFTRARIWPPAQGRSVVATGTLTPNPEGLVSVALANAFELRRV